VEIGYRERVGDLLFNPFSLVGPLTNGTMSISAGIEMCLGVTAIVTSLDESSHFGSAALTDCVNDFCFLGRIALGRQSLFKGLKDLLNFRGH